MHPPIELIEKADTLLPNTHIHLRNATNVFPAGLPAGGLTIERLTRGWVISVALLLIAPCTVALPFLPNVTTMSVISALWGIISSFVIVGKSTILSFSKIRSFPDRTQCRDKPRTETRSSRTCFATLKIQNFVCGAGRTFVRADKQPTKFLYHVSGINTEIIQIRSNFSGPILLALHCLFNLGLLLAPIAVAPFLPDDSGSTSGVSKQEPSASEMQDDLTDILDDHGWSSIVVPYAIGAGLVLLSGLLYFCALCVSKPRYATQEFRSYLQADSSSLTEKTRLVIFATTLIFFFFGCAMEINYTTFLATFAVDYLGWNDLDAANLTSVYALALTVGRFVGIFVIKALGATILLWISLLLCTAGLVPLYFLDQSGGIIWISSIIIGFSVSPIYPTVLKWADETITLTGKFTSILIFVGAFGYTAAPFVQGQLFECCGPLSYLYLCTGAVVSTLIVYLVLNVSVRLIPRRTNALVPSAPECDNDDERQVLLQKYERV